jgi:hypothetical protein
MTTGTKSTTKTTQHTPGPWEVYDGHDGHFGKMRESYITHDNGTDTARITVARMIDCGYDNSADARLIAAAPDLLEALKAVLGSAKVGGTTEERAEAYRAIAKAEGGAQ